MGIKKSRELHSLYTRIDEGVLKLGFSSETRKFSPHLTLGRIKYISDADILEGFVKDFIDFPFSKITISEFILYESILQKDGPVYKPIEIFKL